MDHHGDCDHTCLPAEPACRYGLRHTWNRDGEGYFAPNPGVWSVGGMYKFHCRWCGLGVREFTYGLCQCTPRQCDTREYFPHAVRPNFSEVRAEIRRTYRNVAVRRALYIFVLYLRRCAWVPTELPDTPVRARARRRTGQPSGTEDHAVRAPGKT